MQRVHKKKTLLYGLYILLFILMWGFFIIFSVLSAHQTMQNTLKQETLHAQAAAKNLTAFEKSGNFDNVFALLLSVRDLKSDKTALFSQNGTVLKTSSSGNTYYTKELQQFAIQYLQSPDAFALQKSPSSDGYYIFIPLGLPNGGFLGTEVSIYRLLPSFNSQLQSILFALMICLVLGGVLLLNHFRTKKDHYMALQNAKHKDSFTGLLTISGLENIIRAKHPKGLPVGYRMIGVDITAFHRFNNVFGHAVGDNLLKTISACINCNWLYGTHATGDIFVFVDTREKYDSGAIRNMFRDFVRAEMSETHLQMVDFKFGVYPILDNEHTFQQVYDGTLLALRDAKNSPSVNFITYGSTLQKKADLQSAIEMNMMSALANKEFEVYIQPKYATHNAKCCGGEALVRWQSETLGFLMPDVFIAQFEKNGFIVEIDFYMLERTLEYLQQRIDSKRTLHTISVNQSRIAITHPDYITRLKKTVAAYSVPLEYVELEITESAFQDDYDGVVALVKKIRHLGFSVAMDDFGTGYSSLNTLREIPVNVLKIDKAFLKESDDSKRSRTIISHVIEMSKDLGITVVCEGVETLAQFEFLQNCGCDYVQGFYFSKPLPKAEYEKMFFQGNIA